MHMSALMIRLMAEFLRLVFLSFTSCLEVTCCCWQSSDSSCGAIVYAYIKRFAGNGMDTDDNADVVNVLVTTGQLVPTLGKLLLFKLDGAFKATCKQTCPRCHC